MGLYSGNCISDSRVAESPQFGSV